MSFSFLTWRTIEQLDSGELEIEDLDDDTIKQLSFTILPGGQTVLHHLFQDYEKIAAIYQKSIQNSDNTTYEIPYFEDHEGICPIEKSLKN